jgi:hypothetical protein
MKYLLPCLKAGMPITAMRELKQFGYITAVKQQVAGKWQTHLKFTESAKEVDFYQQQVFRRYVH